MSLIHWWPLNGNLNDYGTLNSSLTNINSTATNNSGKIGKCYYFNGSNNALRAEYPNTTKPTSAISICGWYKPTSIAAGYHHYIINCYESGGVGLSTNDTASIKMQIYVNGGYQSTATTIPDTNWHHWCGTFDGRYIKLYMDGVLKSTKDLGTTYTITYNSTTPWMIGSNPDASGSAAGNFLNGYINDVRIYDHALSKKEVKEISKGLVLHYNFEDEYAEGTTNKYAYYGENPRWSPTFFDGASGNYNYGDSSNGQYEFVTTADKNGNLKKMVKVSLRTARTTNPYIFIDYVLPSLNEYVTVSFDYFATCGTQTIYPYSYRGNYRASRWDESTHQWVGGSSAEIGIPVVPNKWNHVVYRFTRLDDSYTSGPGYVRVGSSSSTSDYWLFDNIQVEEKDHSTPYVNGTRQPGLIYDSSGYGYNGTQVNLGGNIQIVDDTCSGLHSALFGSKCAIDCGSTAMVGPYITVNMFVYFNDSWKTASTYAIASCTEGGGWNFNTADVSGKLAFLAYRSGYKMPAIPLTDISTGWHMITGVVDESSTKIYLDGVLKQSVDGSATLAYPNSHIFIGTEANATSASSSLKFPGSIADFKIFATALSASDILAEYNRKASIDRNGNLFTGEFVAENGKTNISKTGIVESSHFEEGTSVVKMVDGYTELEYIGSTGTQYINTAVPVADDFEFVLDQMSNLDTGNHYLCGSSTSGRMLGTLSNRLWSNAVVASGIAVGKEVRQTIGCHIIANGSSGSDYVMTNYTLGTSQSGHSSYSTSSSSNTVCLFRVNGMSSSESFTCYDFQVFSLGVMVAHLIPAKRNKDNVIGMYDTVNRVFYTNSGTGTFTAGPEKGNLSIVYSNELKEC